MREGTQEDFGGLEEHKAELRSEARRITANPLLDRNRAPEIRAKYWFLSKLRRSALAWADQASPEQKARLLRVADGRDKHAFVPTAKHIASMIVGKEISDEASTAFWHEVTGLEIRPHTNVDWFFVAAALHWSQRSETD